MQLRKDINGLRAIAVIAVVLFHFNSSMMPGGFVGVDVFFVISGFLMTGIIFRGLEQENFSLMKFYVARANRIIPPLAVLCLVLLIFGWFYLTPPDYKILGEHVSSSIGFFSNITYWKESGYFDASSHEKWLLHTWSLSAEWQFYVIYPLMLVIMRKFMTVKLIKIVVLIMTVLGFVFCVVISYKWPNPAYYLLPTRAWEMMVGGAAYLFPFSLRETNKKFLAWGGLTLIIGSCFLVSKDNVWPGYLALVPVLGTFLVIQAQQSFNLLTDNIVFQKLGAWSYSIYLWHWPLVVAIYYFSLNDLFTYVGIVLSVFLGFVSNKYIEKIRFRNDFNGFIDYMKCKPIYITALIGLLGSVTVLSNGANQRFTLDSGYSAIIKETVMPLRSNGYCFYSFNDGYSNVNKEIGTNCHLGSTNKGASTLLFGDSFAGHNEPFFDEVFKANNASFQSIVTNWCTPSLTERFTGPKSHLSYKQCLLNRAFLNENIHNYKNVIFAGDWDNVLKEGQFEDLAAVIQKASSLNLNVFVMAAPYRYEKSPLSDFYRSAYFGDQFISADSGGNDALIKEAHIRLKKLSEQYSKVHFIDRDLLYTKNNLYTVGDTVVPYSLDGRHISMLGSKHSAKYFMQQPQYNEMMNNFDLD